MNHEPVRILLVDADAASRRTLARVLGQEGFVVRGADCGVVGLARLSEEVPDAIVLDLPVADLIAEKLVRTIRGRHPRLPVVLLVGQISEEKRTAFAALGVRACVDQVDAPEQLAVVLRRLGQPQLPSLERLS